MPPRFIFSWGFPEILVKLCPLRRILDPPLFQLLFPIFLNTCVNEDMKICSIVIMVQSTIYHFMFISIFQSNCDDSVNKEYRPLE